jgi:hypothetical protein
MAILVGFCEVEAEYLSAASVLAFSAWSENPGGSSAPPMVSQITFFKPLP